MFRGGGESVSRTESVGFCLTRVFAFFVLSNLFDMLVLEESSGLGVRVSCPGSPRWPPTPSWEQDLRVRAAAGGYGVKLHKRDTTIAPYVPSPPQAGFMQI